MARPVSARTVQSCAFDGTLKCAYSCIEFAGNPYE
jgi:hypothetical protein